MTYVRRNTAKKCQLELLDEFRRSITPLVNGALIKTDAGDWGVLIQFQNTLTNSQKSLVREFIKAYSPDVSVEDNAGPITFHFA
ncbi:MAG: hypothetical protein AAFY84_06150 [Pseudomonadota bacterium]